MVEMKLEVVIIPVSEEALARAVGDALQRHKQAGNPVLSGAMERCAGLLPFPTSCVPRTINDNSDTRWNHARTGKGLVLGFSVSEREAAGSHIP